MFQSKFRRTGKGLRLVGLSPDWQRSPPCWAQEQSGSPFRQPILQPSPALQVGV